MRVVLSTVRRRGIDALTKCKHTQQVKEGIIEIKNLDMDVLIPCRFTGRALTQLL
ncbi:hypothetical protein N473_19755 [Pseudoalteromonas luteoviolacea CPMOR-1]|uniref:Uncharacterized protein n=1 Tax=Pseudoalteromonas luteoviolacea CPMOR-1 TaxID=1365248 RepID=A0A167K9R9_9GAMM|nr:hypothetical protein [Pseudoalteromonas luteoviolacea]KZN62343.1 hypothetical protein N473_19755 [Pseudoalteromonas luteoviolacea CPMOR-1]